MTQPSAPTGLSSARLPAPARGLHRIGFVSSTMAGEYSQMLLAGAVTAARARAAELVCLEVGHVASPHDDIRHQVLCDLVCPEALDGAVIWAQGLDVYAGVGGLRAFVHARGLDLLPLVSIGDAGDIPAVTWDMAAGVAASVTHLIDVHGCRRIAFIHGPGTQVAAREMYAGYRRALFERGIPLDPALVTPPGDWGPALGHAAVRVLLDERGAVFDALVGSDEDAMAAIADLHARGLRVPGDIAVAGFNDIAPSRFATPPLTTVQRPIAGAAARAVEMLLDRLDGTAVPPRVVLPARVVARRSCGCLPQPLQEALASWPEEATENGPPSSAGRGRAEGDGRPASNPQRAAAEAALAATLATLGEPDPATLATRLADAVHVDLADPACRTLAILEQRLQHIARSGSDPGAWQAVVSTLRRRLLPALAGDTRSRQRGEDLCHQLRVLVGEAAQSAQIALRAAALERAAALREVGRRLIASFDVAALLDTLAMELPRLGIPGCYIALYEDPACPAEWSRLVLGYDAEGRLMLEPGGLRFATRGLLPPGVWPRGGPHTLMVEPLWFADEQLGFALFVMGPLDGGVYGGLRAQISGALKGALLATRNVDLYRQAVAAHRAAEEANRLKSRFLSTVGHELRTPLTLIAGTAEMLLHRQPGSSEPLPGWCLADVEAIHASAQHLSRLIGDVLDLASSHAGELRLSCRMLDLRGVLAGVALLAQSLATARGLAWRVDVPDDLPPVWGDRTRLQQVVLNLVSNAVKFTERGEVALAASVGPDGITITVSDTGMGIPAEECEAVFDEFRQSQRTVERGYGGMGLGLAISRRLIELHGGRIGVRSSGEEGAGSTFYFTLPAAALPDAPADLTSRTDMDRGTAPAAGAQPCADRVVLVRAAQGPGCDLLRERLARSGFAIEEVVALGDGWLDAIIGAPPVAVIVEAVPAEERGWELVSTLRADPATRDVPVVFYALSPDGSQGSILELDYLGKPFEEARLVAALERQGLRNGDGACPRTLLLVDDELHELDLLARVVQSHLPTCRILKAGGGSQALAILNEVHPDLVLLDLMMPGTDGFTVLELMQAREAARHVPVIVLTAQCLTVDDMARLQRGVVAVLRKGVFAAPEVVGQIEAVLSGSKRLGCESQRVARLAMAYIHAHYVEPITRDELARAVAVSDRYLTRCFHAETGLTPVAYINRYRVEQAKRLLTPGTLTITEVSQAVGFSDSNYFARVFRAEAGIAPGAYQRGLRS